MESIGGVARLVRPASTGRLTVTRHAVARSARDADPSLMQADEATYHGEAEAVALFRARAARRGATEAIADLERFDSGCADPGLAHGECNALAFALRLDGDGSSPRGVNLTALESR